MNFVRKNLPTNENLSCVCEKLIGRCKELADDVTSELPVDNMTVMIAIMK